MEFQPISVGSLDHEGKRVEVFESDSLFPREPLGVGGKLRRIKGIAVGAHLKYDGGEAGRSDFFDHCGVALFEFCGTPAGRDIQIEYSTYPNSPEFSRFGRYCRRQIDGARVIFAAAADGSSGTVPQRAVFRFSRCGKQR